MSLKITYVTVFLTIIAAQAWCHKMHCTFIEYRGKNDSDGFHDETCTAHAVCRKTFNISFIDMPPYSNGRHFERIVEGCCGTSCTNFNIVKRYTNISEVKLLRTVSSDFILPFLGSSSAERLYGYHFIPFANVPHAYYITPAHAPPIARMLENCAGMHALIILCLLTAIVSGLIIWAFETVFQDSDRQPFLRGVFEGIWWSLTIVTPGYGAKVVRSIPAKVYSIIWILVGVVMFSLMTSAFTAELMSVMGRHYDSMAGAKVGVLKYRDYDASIVVREGGIIHETGASDFHSDLLSLVRMLRTKDIDGMLLDKYTLAYTRQYLRNQTEMTEIDPGSEKGRHLTQRKSHDKHEEGSFLRSSTSALKDDIEFFFKNTDSTLKEYNGDKLSYGVLVKKQADYDFLNGAVRDNRLSSETALESQMNQIFPRKKQEVVIDPSHSLPFWNVIRWIGVAIACMFVVGLTHETYQRCRKNDMDAIGNGAVNRLIYILKDKKQSRAENRQLIYSPTYNPKK